MSEKLKTLKDIKYTQEIKRKLTKEAIKWLKKIDHPVEDQEVKSRLKLINIDADNCLYGARRFIIEFFNITDEDLNE